MQVNTVTERTNTKRNLKKLLENHDSRSKAITRREIKNILGYHNDRQLRFMIHELRSEGLPVMFSTDSPHGYWLPSTWAELDEGVRRWRSYIIELAKDLSNTKKAGALWLKPAIQKQLL